jgi:DNA-binding response OmpR family regulator
MTAVDEGRGSAHVQRLLVVEDEPRAQRLLKANLEPAGFALRLVGTGEEALAAFSEWAPDLILLDLMLPGMSGLEVLARIRETSDVPVIIVSAKDQVADKVAGLHLGADDYLVKPYAMEELLARIDAVCRRQKGGTPGLRQVGAITLDLRHHRVEVEGREVALSRTEYELLTLLGRHVNRVVVADALLSEVWGPEYRGEYAILHVTMSRLRKKLGKAGKMQIVTRPGVGYVLREGKEDWPEGGEELPVGESE